MQTTFCVGLKGILEGNIVQLEGLILNQLTKFSVYGFSDYEFESDLHTIHFHLQEFQVDDSKGVSFILPILSSCNKCSISRP